MDSKRAFANSQDLINKFPRRFYKHYLQNSQIYDLCSVYNLEQFILCCFLSCSVLFRYTLCQNRRAYAFNFHHIIKIPFACFLKNDNWADLKKLDSHKIVSGLSIIPPIYIHFHSCRLSVVISRAK